MEEEKVISRIIGTRTLRPFARNNRRMKRKKPIQRKREKETNPKRRGKNNLTIEISTKSTHLEFLKVEKSVPAKDLSR